MLEKAKERLPVECVGVAVLGSTGTGKSTLVNAFFPGAKAKTGYGAPITQEAEWFPKKRDKHTRFRILDTRGFEEKDYEETVEAALEAVDETNESEDRNDHAHIAWLVIKEGSGRVQDSHKDIATRFTEAGIPVIAVLTEAIADDEEFRGEVRKLLPEVKDVIPVNSIPKGTRAGSIEPFGLDTLYGVTSRSVPPRSAHALTESADSSLVPIEEKRELAKRRVKWAAAAAAAAGTIPIPIVDAVVLMPIQASMIVSISRAYGMKVDKESSMALVAAIAVPVAATSGGSALTASIMKFVPGAGTLAGSAIGGTTASAITGAIGRVYMMFLHKLCEANGNNPPQTSQVVRQFGEFYKEHGAIIAEALKTIAEAPKK
ncbi:MAG: DUF697 domain-containing protein [Rhodobacteraceae bacterium]|nr:DUF697 domain-containing protein [Paracoccaceae bacterium]